MRDQPNLLFIFTDEQSADTLGAYGNALIQTPNLDRLAEESVIFENAYATQSVCTPSRASIMTGLYPHSCGCLKNNDVLPRNVPCFPEMGDWSGYKTGYHGKWHLGDEPFAQHGFQEWRSIDDGYRPHFTPGRDPWQHTTYYDFLVENGFPPDTTLADGFQFHSRPYCARLPEAYSKPAYLAQESSRFIRENQDRPFVLFVNFFEPHFPYFGPRDGQYDPEQMPLPASYYRELAQDQALKARLLRLGFAEHGCDAGPLETEADWQRVMAHYWGLVSQVDTHAGTILDTLRACGLYDDTIIVFTSDHGDMMGAHRLLAKTVRFEEAIKVPLTVRMPGLTRGGERIDAPVSQVDLVPTLLAALGQPTPEHLEGYSWMPLLEGSGALVEEDVYVEWTGNDGWGHGAKGGVIPSSWLELASEDEIRARMAGDPSLTIITPNGRKYTVSASGEQELYDLQSDPGELTNLAGRPEQAALVQDLRARMRAWQERTGSSAPIL